MIMHRMSNILVIVSVICVFYFEITNSVCSGRTRECRSCRGMNQFVMLKDGDNKPRKKIVSPNELESLFGNNVKSRAFEFDVVEIDQNIYNDEDDENESTSDQQKADTNTSINSLEQEPKSSNENQNSQSTITANSGKLSYTELLKYEQVVSNSRASQSESNEEQMCYDDEYLNLSNKVDKNVSNKISDNISINSDEKSSTNARSSMFTSNDSETDDDDSSDSNTYGKIFQYEPQKKVIIDPMVYGAYRRSKLPPPIVDKESKNSKGLNKSGRKNNNKTSNKDKKSSDDFYEQIKKFGSAPGAKGASSSTGVAEPPPGMKSVTPKKSPYTKNRRQIVTPDEINALFVNKNSYGTEESNDQSNKINASNKENTNDENEENDNDEGNFLQNIKNSFSSAMSQVELRSNANTKNEENENENSDTEENDSSKQLQVTEMGVMSPASSSFDPNIRSDELFPKWLIDAEKEKIKKEKEQRAIARGKGKKKLTDDWRFWAALITGIGFAAAFYNVYQQTGGFSNGDGISPFTFGPTNGAGFNGYGSGGGSDELII